MVVVPHPQIHAQAIGLELKPGTDAIKLDMGPGRTTGQPLPHLDSSVQHDRGPCLRSPMAGVLEAVPKQNKKRCTRDGCGVRCGASGRTSHSPARARHQTRSRESRRQPARHRPSHDSPRQRLPTGKDLDGRILRNIHPEKDSPHRGDRSPQDSSCQKVRAPEITQPGKKAALGHENQSLHLKFAIICLRMHITAMRVRPESLLDDRSRGSTLTLSFPGGIKPPCLFPLTHNSSLRGPISYWEPSIWSMKHSNSSTRRMNHRC